jgi:hypothetical protein
MCGATMSQVCGAITANRKNSMKAFFGLRSTDGKTGNMTEMSFEDVVADESVTVDDVAKAVGHVSAQSAL